MNALLITDVQNDFLPGGALEAPGGDEVVPIANRLRKCFPLVIATQDWHPPNHQSFASRHPGKQIGDVIDLDGLPQILWPEHCIQNTWGAEFAPGLDLGFDAVIRKGTNPRIDSYSAFFDNQHLQETELAAELRAREVSDLYVLGLTTDYCVKFTALDGVMLGFRMHVIEDGCRGVNRSPGDAERALDQMRAAGVDVVRSDELVRDLNLRAAD